MKKVNRNQIEIKKWLLDRGLTMRDVARRAKVSFPFVSLVIKGERRSPKVFKVLRRLGCPQQLLINYKKEADNAKQSRFRPA